jgi:flagellar hook-associated protein 1
VSLSSSLHNALSGLTANSRRAEVISNNIANVSTPGYARREVQVNSRILGQAGSGVQVGGILRRVDTVLITDRRIAGADAGGRSVIATFLAQLEAAVGTPEDAYSVGSRLAGLETALIAASARPDSESSLAGVAQAAVGLTDQLARASAQIQSARLAADSRIASEVGTLNDALTRVADLNLQIRNYSNSGRDTATLMDQRQQLVDSISSIVPLREIVREDGQIALYSQGGAALVENRATTIGFTTAGVITPDMTLQSGALSGLTLGGNPMPMDYRSQLSGGSLAALFKVRDDLATGAQAQLDAVARDLIARTSAPGLDGSRASGDPGLFTDAGGSLDPANETGLAARMTLNPIANPQTGGQLWHLRDGLGATGLGDPGDASLLIAWQDALTAPRSPDSGSFMPGDRSLSALTADMLSQFSTARVSAESEASYAEARSAALQKMELDGGVDTDQELQDLLLVEQAYSANAKIIQTIDDLMKILLGM